MGTLGSHSALNVLKGAKEEGFRTLCICTREAEITYRRFPVADSLIVVESFRELMEPSLQRKLRALNTILVPHGSFNAYLDLDEMIRELRVPLFGNRRLLPWEVDREKQRAWLAQAGLRLPKAFGSPSQIDRLTIVKLPGAKGGRGYFLASSPQSFYRKSEDIVKRGLMQSADLEKVVLQEYVVGVTVYPSYFRSIIDDEVELFCVDRRYEASVDGIGRIPAREQLEAPLNPSYSVAGNIPIVLRESLLAEYLRMGDRVVEASKGIAPPGIVGPFCLETAVTDTLEIYTFEISARIVAGTNVSLAGSPYSFLKHGEGMYMGRRIARELRRAIEAGRLEAVVS